MKNIKIFLMALVIVAIINSCYKSKLNQPVPALLSGEVLANKTGVEGLLIGAYSMLDGVATPAIFNVQLESTAASNWVYGSICGSEAYKGADAGDPQEITDMEIFIVNANNDFLDAKWGAIYEGVQRANSVLRLMRQATDMSTADTIEVRAEALFLRAHYHFEAKKMWNKIPFVDEYVTYDAGNYHIANDTTWVHIEKDLIYAMHNLKVSQALEVGRANRYAAEALLAKAYLFEGKYSLAKPLLTDLITNGVTAGGDKYRLLDNYSDNFNPALKNSSESVFACQSSVNDAGGGLNGNLGDFLNFPYGELGGYGFFQPSQYLVNHFKTDPSTGLPDLISYNDTDVKNDEGLLSSDPFVPYAGPLDPRLDWTVGRRGIPYLDWNIYPGNDWVRVQSYGGPYGPKKCVVSQAQQAGYTQNGWNQLTAMNINLIRYADVLLWAAETEVKIGSLDQAEMYVNMIRSRAMNPAGFVHTYIDPANPTGGFTNIPAANYVIKTYPAGYFAAQGQAFAFKAVQYERMLELGMEGHRFFDLVRWKIAGTEINGYFLKEQNLRDYMKGAVFTPNKNEYFPIPQHEIDLSAGADGKPKMTQNPGY